MLLQNPVTKISGRLSQTEILNLKNFFMKRLFFSISLCTCLFSISAFANDGNLPDVLSSFYKTFQNAQNVNWIEVDDMLRIGFISNGHQKFAYYSNDELIVVATEIKVEELPTTLQAQLSPYKDFVVSHVYELVKNDVKEYCVMMQNDSKYITLKGKKAWKVYVEGRK
jgi:hypothetical protein